MKWGFHVKILITGATGNVGGYVAANLLDMGEKVVVAGTHTQKLEDMFQDHAETVYFDFTK